jgi:FecR protein
MKTFLAKIFSCRSITLLWVPLFFAAATLLTAAAPLQEARVSQVIQDVRLLEAHGARAAMVNDRITLERAVRTGKQSRAEVTFTDLTITRLGANTIFSLKAGAREVDLTSGTILLSVPSGAAPVRANTTAVTAAVTGGTALLATGPPTKFMVLEGIGTIYPRGHPEKAVTVHAGEMVVVTEHGVISEPMQFDVSLVLQTSLLIIDFPPLPNLPLILEVANQQLAEQQLFGIITRLFPWNWFDLLDLPDLNANANPILIAARGLAPTPTVSPITPTPSPSKTGTPSTISSPNPYLITSGTVIKTDPSITTNGVTDYGKIYRGPTNDGPFSLWAFGSTSAFDNAIGFDAILADAGSLPIAVFKFQALSLTGNPTIDLTNGGVTKLGLISVDGITSGSPGGILTFTGLDLLLLATVNGSINLGSDISFQGLNALTMYARGAGSNLILNSPISNVGILGLAAEGSIHLTNPGTMNVGQLGAMAGGNLTLDIGGSLMLNGSFNLETIVLPGTTVATGANLTLDVTGDYTNSSATESSRLSVTNESAHIGTGGNIAVNIGGDLTTTGAAGDFALVVQNTNGQIDNGGNLNLTVSGNVHVNGLDVELQNYDGSPNPAGHIGTGGNIVVELGGNLSANSYVSVFLNNRGGGMIDSGGNLTFNVNGAMSITGAGLDGFSAQFIVSTRYDDIGGNTTPSFIGSDVSLFLHAASIDMAGALFGSGISNRGGSVIGGNATATWDVPGAVTIGGDASWWVLNDIPPDHQFTPPGGGTIHGDATVRLNIGGDLTVAGDADVFIANLRNGAFPGLNGGTIDSDATVHISAANVSVGGNLDVSIDNEKNGGGGGTAPSIGGNAAISLNIASDLTTQGDASFEILNHNGGTIGGNATMNLSAANITANSLLAQIDNSNDGTIGGNALINVRVSGGINSMGDATFEILNNDAGRIGGSADILFTTGDDLTAGSVNAFINDRNAGSITSGAEINFDIGNNLSTLGDATFLFSSRNDGSGGGTVGLDARVLVSAASISTGGFFLTAIGTSGGGSIGGDAISTVSVPGGDLTAQGGILLSIQDGGFTSINPTVFRGGGHIGGDAIVTLTARNIITLSTASGGPGGNGAALEASIYTNGQGFIGEDAIINVSASQRISAALGSILFWIPNLNFEGFGGGMITGDATIHVIAASISSGSTLFSIIDNSGGGTIGGDATVNVRATNISANSLVAFIDNRNGGVIDSNATLTFNLAGNLTTQGGADIEILNDQNSSSNGLPGGSIGSAAMLNISAADISIGTDFTARILNHRGQNAPGPGAGSIGTDATLTINAGSLRAGGMLDISIFNRDAGAGSGTGGTIGRNAAINFSVTNSLQIGGAADFQILNESVVTGSPGGTIGGDATIDVSAANITADSLLAQIDNVNGTIGGAANVALNVGHDVAAPNGITLQILNNNSGHIGPGADVLFSVGGAVAPTANLDLFIDNSGGGVIDNGGNVTMNAVGPVMMNGPLVLEVDNYNAGMISNGANVIGHFVGDVTDTIGQFHSLNFFVLNGGNDFVGDLGGGTIGTGGNIDVTFDGNAGTTPTATTGSFAAEIANDHGNIATGGNISLTIGGNATAGGSGFVTSTSNRGGHIGTGGNITVSIGGDLTSVTQAFFGVFNNGGSIGSSTNVTLNLRGDLTAQSGAEFDIYNNDNGSGSGGGTIGTDATINVNVANISSGPEPDSNALVVQIDNTGGNIGGSASVTLAASGNVNAQGNAFLQILNFNDGGNAPGMIGGDAILNVSAGGDITTQDGFFQIRNDDSGNTGGGGFIGGNATINVTANNITSSFLFDGILNSGGSIGADARVNANLTGDLTSTQESAQFSILNNNDGSGSGGGTITGSAVVNVNARNITTSPNGGDFNALVAQVDNRGGHIGGNASVTLAASGNVNAQGNAFLQILNFNDGSSGPGTIGNPVVGLGDATLNISAASISTTGFLYDAIDNSSGGSIAGSANLTLNLSGGLNTQGNAATFIINNSNGGTIGGPASMNVAANNITANSLVASIDNTEGIVGYAEVNMNVSSTATVATDATVAIYGSNGSVEGAAITINGGSYNVGGQFLTYIDGDGLITFNNASAHADVLKAGVFGANGVLNVGGGILSADTELKLYAPGTNGQVNFVSNVTLGGNGAKILAANSITIFNNVVVTIGGPNPADVFTNNANYTGFGGNNSTTGTFAGAGANNPLPLIDRPPFGPASPSKTTPRRGTVPTGSSTTTSGGIVTTRNTAPRTAINVRDSSQLLSMLDQTVPGPDGKLTVSHHDRINHTLTANRINTDRIAKADSRIMDVRRMPGLAARGRLTQ